MYVNGLCKKCLTQLQFDIGDLSLEEAKAALQRTEMGECPGMHVEMGKMSDYYTMDWDHTFATAEAAKLHIINK